MNGDIMSDHKANRLAVSAFTFTVETRCLYVAWSVMHVIFFAPSM